MSKLLINDLALSKDLDRTAVMKIRGGYTGGWQVARLEPQGISGAQVPGSIYNIITNNYNLYQNPTFFNVFTSGGNGNSGNSGNVVNNFDISTLSVNAASPALTGG
jgi:hypothetical protein